MTLFLGGVAGLTAPVANKANETQGNQLITHAFVLQEACFAAPATLAAVHFLCIRNARACVCCYSRDCEKGHSLAAVAVAAPMDELLFCACNSEEPRFERVSQLLEQGAQPAAHANEYASLAFRPPLLVHCDCF